MTLTQQIDENLNQSMKAQDADRTRVLRSIKSALHNASIEAKGELSDEQEIKTLSSEAKKRKEAIELYKKSGREELAESETKELSVIDSYLPEKMSPEELGKIVDEAIAQTGATTPADMGQVMGVVMNKVKGQADGAQVSAMVKSRLSK